jgi:APA family basic amino acid/polyamine antiporter
MLSFVITAIVCSFTALCYAEFASMVPISGSAYTYSYATLGELLAWIIGWDLIIEYAVGNIGVAISWANYFKTFIEGFSFRGSHVKIPAWLSIDIHTAYQKPHLLDDVSGWPQFLFHTPELFGRTVVINVLAIGIVAALTVILVWGVKESARFNAVMVGIKIIVLLFFIAVGFMWLKPDNWTPFKPNGWTGVSAGAAVIFFAYIGFDAVSTVAEETRNPQRNLPIGIIGSLIICTVFYVLVSIVFTGLIPYNVLKTTLATEQAEPLTLAIKHANPAADWSVGFVAFGSVIAHTAVLLVYQLGQTRIFYSMARDGLLPPLFYKLHPRFRTPWLSTIVIGIIVAAFSTVASIDEMVDLTNIGTLFAFILVCIGIIVLRVKDPDRPRPFRVPGGYLFPILGIISCLYLIYYLPPTSWLRFAAWLNLGFVVYIGYGVVHSRLTGRKYSDQPGEHDASTAYTGAWLAVAGVLMLLLTRAFDVFQDAFKGGETLEWSARWKGAWSQVWSADAWLQPSWFLLVPLAVNAFLLCPIIYYRAFNALSAKPLGQSRRIGASLAISTLLIVATVVYAFLVASHAFRPS